MIRVEGDVVVDPVPLHVVLVAGGGVTDRVEAGGLGDLRVGPLRQVGQRAGDERLGERLLLGRHAGRAREVDRLGRVERRRGGRVGRRRRRRVVVVDALVGAPVPSAAWPAPWPSRAANGPHSLGAIHTCTIGLPPPALTVPGGAVAVGIGEPGDDRLAVVVELPAQVVVDVPRHQRAAVVDERRVVEVHVLGDEHRRHERPLVAVDLVHERLRLVRVEERVVADVRRVDPVLEAGGGVADGEEAQGRRSSTRRRTAGGRRACWRRAPRPGPAGRPSRPATPEKSIGAVGSHGRGHAVGSAARMVVGGAVVVGVPGRRARIRPSAAVSSWACRRRPRRRCARGCARGWRR